MEPDPITLHQALTNSSEFTLNISPAHLVTPLKAYILLGEFRSNEPPFSILNSTLAVIQNPTFLGNTQGYVPLSMVTACGHSECAYIQKQMAVVCLKEPCPCGFH